MSGGEARRTGQAREVKASRPETQTTPRTRVPQTDGLGRGWKVWGPALQFTGPKQKRQHRRALAFERWRNWERRPGDEGRGSGLAAQTEQGGKADSEQGEAGGPGTISNPRKLVPAPAVASVVAAEPAPASVIVNNRLAVLSALVP